MTKPAETQQAGPMYTWEPNTETKRTRKDRMLNASEEKKDSVPLPRKKISEQEGNSKLNAIVVYFNVSLSHASRWRGNRSFSNAFLV